MRALMWFPLRILKASKHDDLSSSSGGNGGAIIPGVITSGPLDDIEILSPNSPEISPWSSSPRSKAGF
jgi:hypothetical protein